MLLSNSESLQCFLLKSESSASCLKLIIIVITQRHRLIRLQPRPVPREELSPETSATFAGYSAAASGSGRRTPDRTAPISSAAAHGLPVQIKFGTIFTTKRKRNNEVTFPNLVPC